MPFSWYFTASCKYVPWKKKWLCLAWRQHRRGGVGFPACRGSTWLCAGGSAAVVWPPAFHYRDYARLHHHPNLCWKPPPHSLSQLYSFIINTSWRQSHSPSFTTHCKLLTVVPLTTQRHAGTLWFTLESSNTRCYNNVTPISILGGKKSTLRHFQIELNYLSPQVEEKSHTWLCNTWQPALNTLHPRGGVWGGSPLQMAPGRPSCRVSITC